MPTQLTLIRHANTEWNTAGRWQGHSDIPLSELGVQQAQALGRRLREQHFDAVYTSDLSRTQQTAHYALQAAEAPAPILDTRLREFQFGDFEGLTEAQNRQHAGWDAWQADPWHAAVPSGESLQALSERAAAWASELPAGKVVAFSHGLTIRALLWRLLGWPLPTAATGFGPFALNVRVPHTSITRLERGVHGWELLSLADAAHLEGWAQHPNG